MAVGGYFVWSKMQAEAGELLASIIARKEAERVSGGGLFFWGIGNSLGQAVIDAAKLNGGSLPVMWSVMRSRPRAIDVAPAEVVRWTAYLDREGREYEVPPHVTVTSRRSGRSHHFALACCSASPLILGDHGPFDPSRCTTRSGKAPGASQVTALLSGPSELGQSGAPYRIAFRAELVAPWAVRLVRPVPFALPTDGAARR
ncbi:hypothetical protein GCM10011611_03210 [Aliidongia dinghuensis]|uniref:Uncharacterized protein n=1 Tax=Aliidongia dinghuensis TaxID=1867774 RepID=A0A8J2YQ73_9PROT|nr:hypothetical protein [Aliidongia dinghuensis]GGF00982.1 hypothetical protein GCM10011611_03210 [Aliidongia dinghuensis]